MTKLKEEFFTRKSEQVAKDLLGSKLVRLIGNKKLEGVISETAAYEGRSKHTSGEGINYATGKIYIMSHRGNLFLNIATEKEGVDSCILIRKLIPSEGVKAKTDGPGKLTRALKIDESLDGGSIYGEKLWIEEKTFDYNIRKKQDKSMASNCLGYYEIVI